MKNKAKAVVDKSNNKHAIDNNVQVIKDDTKAQHESKYDSHSEGVPHQKTVVSTDSNPDRVSNDNRDTSVKNDTNDCKDDGSEDDDIENNVNQENHPSFPKSNTSSFPSISS